MGIVGIVGIEHIYIYRDYGLPNRHYIDAIRKTMPEKLAKINSTLPSADRQVDATGEKKKN